MDSESENITILLISSSKLLKNKFIESLNNSLNQFTLMNKTIESLKSSNERILVPCLISDYTLETETNTNYVQLVDASDTSLINNLISRSINSTKAFQFYVNAIVYLYDEANPDTFYYVKSIHTDIKKTFTDFASNDSLLFLICNMINAATIGHQQQTSTNSKLLSLLDKFLAEFSNMQYVSQEYEDTILGPKQKINDENKLKTNFDQLVSRNLAKFKLGLSKKKLSKLVKKSEDTDVPSINIRSESESIKSADLDMSSKSNELINKSKVSKKMYQGEMAHNLRNGFGIYQYENKYFRYEGEWKNGIKHGQGKLIMKDGSYIEGEFKNGEIFGKGYKYDKFRESEYTGDFLEGCYHGKGTMRSKNNFVYQGDFFENMRHGYGELNEFKINQSYQGQWYYNKRHGQGVQRYNDGSTYTGDWIRDKRQGHGELEYLDGTYYDGQWRNDVMNGLGTFKHSSGYYFEGLFSNGIPSKLETTSLVILVDSEFLDSEERFRLNEASPIPRITVKCLNEDQEPLMEDGRVIQLTLAIKIDITDTATYENQITTEFGFSVVPVALFSNNSMQIKDESTIIEEGIVDKSSTIINELDGTTNDTTLELEQILSIKGKQDENVSNNIAASYSSKPPEISQQNEAGITHFDGLYVDIVPFPRKAANDPNKEKSAKVRIIHKGSAASHHSSSSKNTIQTRESTFLLDNNTLSCVLIAEDASKPVPFGIRPKSSYIECIINLKTKTEEPEVKKSSDSTITNKKLKKKKQSLLQEAQIETE